MNKQSDTLTSTNPFGVEIHPVMHDGKPMFRVADICASLGDNTPQSALRNVPERHKLMRLVTASGQDRKMWYVTEAGLYRILLRSRSPAAERFTDWVTEEVLPAIRKTGFYANPESLMRIRDYLAAREIEANPSGFGRTCMAVCRRRRVEPKRDRWSKGDAYPVGVLDEAARGKPAGRGPLVRGADAGVFVFINKSC